MGDSLADEERLLAGWFSTVRFDRPSPAGVLPEVSWEDDETVASAAELASGDLRQPSRQAREARG